MIEELRDIFGRLPDEPLPDLSVFPPELFEFTSPLGTYFDAFPIHVLTTASLAPSRRRAAGAVRPSALPSQRPVESRPASPASRRPGGAGGRCASGRPSCRCTCPTARCSMTVQAQPGLPKDPLVLRAIVRDADQNLGVYATVAAPGNVRVGDPVELV